MQIQFPKIRDSFNLSRTVDEKNLATTTFQREPEDVWYLLEALETKIGADNDDLSTSFDYRIRQLETFIAAPLLTTRGDLLGFTTKIDRLPIGPDTYILTADSTKPFGFSWQVSGAPVGQNLSIGNSLNITSGSGIAATLVALTIDTIQDIRTTAKPTFSGLNLVDGSAWAQGTANNGIHFHESGGQKDVSIDVQVLSGFTHGVHRLFIQGYPAENGTTSGFEAGHIEILGGQAGGDGSGNSAGGDVRIVGGINNDNGAGSSFDGNVYLGYSTWMSEVGYVWFGNQRVGFNTKFPGIAWANSIPYVDSTKIFNPLLDVAIGSVLVSQGTTTPPAWSASPSITSLTLATALAIASGGTNNSSAYTTGSIIYSNGTSLTQDNANFFWDGTNHRLALGTTSATYLLDARASGAAVQTVARLQNNQAAGSSNVSRMVFGLNRTTGGMTDYAAIGAISTSISNTVYSGAALVYVTSSGGALTEIARFGSPYGQLLTVPSAFTYGQQITFPGTGANVMQIFYNNQASGSNRGGDIQWVARANDSGVGGDADHYQGAIRAIWSAGVNASTVDTWASDLVFYTVPVAGNLTEVMRLNNAGVLTVTSYAGQSSIVTLGTITTGTWSATTIAMNKGGTGVDLSASGSSTAFLAQNGSHVISARSLVAADIPNIDIAKITTGNFISTITAGNSLQFTAGAGTGNAATPTIDTIQDIRITATPQWTRLGLGIAADTNFLLYLSKTSSLSDNIIRINSGATPAYSQFKILANGLGALSWINYGVDNNGYGFDQDFSGGNWVARHTSVAQLYKNGDAIYFAGNTGQVVGNNTTANNILMKWDLATGNITTAKGKFTQYMGLTLTNNGFGALLATSDLTAQGAAISATTIYAVPAAGVGFYRISWVATMTRAATTSCTLGGTTGFQVIFTDQNDSVVKTSNPAAVTYMTSSTNATGTTVSGVVCAYCKASTNLQYAFGYTSSGGTSMQFDLSIRVEFIG